MIIGNSLRSTQEEDIESQLITEIRGIKATTARLAALALVAGLQQRRTKVKQADTLENKLDAMSDLIVLGGYISALSVAIDNDDKKLLSKIRIKK